LREFDEESHEVADAVGGVGRCWNEGNVIFEVFVLVEQGCVEALRAALRPCSASCKMTSSERRSNSRLVFSGWLSRTSTMSLAGLVFQSNNLSI